jgi:membrane protease YdiL (CAAX protease family)
MKAVAVYLAVYAAALALLAVFEKFDWTEPLFILVIAGGVFTLLAWLATRGYRALDGLRMLAPWWGIAAYLVFLGVVLAIGFPKNEWFQLAVKLVVFVAIPIAAFRMRLPLRFNARDAMITIALMAVMSAFQLLVGRAKFMGVLPVAASLIWMTFEAGFTEEIAFRALIQTRLEEWTRSRAMGIVVASLLFAVVHAPGLYLRPERTGEGIANPSILFAVCYTIVIISPLALFFGTLWMRTRNVLIVALVHGAVDAIPNAADVAKALGM